jgi:membrane-associated phospholipid phosphatase
MTGVSGEPVRGAPERFFLDPVPPLWLAGGMLSLVGLIAVLVPQDPTAIERSWSEAMRDLQTRLLTDIALVFNWLGRTPGQVLAFAVVALLLLHARRWLALGAFAVAESLALLLPGLLKALIGRPRPPDGLVHPVGSSFPSGHTTYAGAICVALVLLFSAAGPRKRWWALAAVAISAMAWSRTYLQVHWLIDVIAGGLLGAGISLLVFSAAQVLARRANRPELAAES